MLAVTTRNKLHSPRFFLPMVWARRRIKRQLHTVPGIVRFITGIASPTEFYTITIWESRATMFNFTASDNHRQMMWMFTRWAESFWSMRWQLTTDEVGCWDNLKLADGDFVTGLKPQIDQPAWLTRSQMTEVLTPYFDTVGRLDRRTFDPTTSAGKAMLARIPTRSPLDVYRLKREIHSWSGTPGLLRSTLGLDWGKCLVITIWQADALDQLRVMMERLKECFRNTWAMRLNPGDYEIGHWDNLRLRQLRRSIPTDEEVRRR